MAKKGKDVIQAAAGRVWNYTPVMQFYRRLIETAMFDIHAVYAVPCPYGDPTWLQVPSTVSEWLMQLCGERWDAAIMARDWIRRGSPNGREDRDGYTVSFDHCCEALGLNADAERMGLLSLADSIADFDTDEVWARIEHLANNPPDEVSEALFDAPRVVPALDQGSLFALMEAA